MNLPQNIKDVDRFRKIASTVLIIEGEKLLSWWQMWKKVPDSEKERAVSLRKGFENLGGTFIKLGQLLSLRPDLISPAYCDELRRLQDNVPPFSSSTAKKIVASELKKPLRKVFKSFDSKPIAAASIGQVHRAVLKTGQHVVVKVQRPKIHETFKTDIDILSFVAKHWEKHSNPQIIRPTQIVQEFKRYTDSELDYIHEARNVDRFFDNFANDKTVIIPKVFWQYTTAKVLVLEEIKGKRIDQSLPKSQKERHDLMDKVANIVFKQIFEHGVFHADPHPGNIFRTPDGKIAMLDFGIVGIFDEELQARITDLFIAMIERDIKGMTRAMIQLNMVDEIEINEQALREDLREYLGKYYGTEISVIKIGELFERLITIARNHKLTLPANFVLFGKSLMTLEGLGEHIDPHFNLVECAQPYVKGLIKKRTKPKAVMHRARKTLEKLKYFIEVFPEQSSQLLKDVKRADKAIDAIHTDIEILTTEMDRSSNRMVLGILISGLIVGGALMADIPQISLWGIPILPLLGFAIAMFLGLILIGSIHREKKFKEE